MAIRARVDARAICVDDRAKYFAARDALPDEANRGQRNVRLGTAGQERGIFANRARRTIFGGRLGFAQHYFLRAWRRVNARVSRQLHAPYRQLARAGILRTLIPGRWRPRVVTFQATRLLMIGTRVIGRYDAQRRIWHIQRPFRLFVDEAEL